MLYSVRLNGFLIDASSRDEAYAKALRRLRESPESAVGNLTAAGSPKRVSILRRLITGE